MSAIFSATVVSIVPVMWGSSGLESIGILSPEGLESVASLVSFKIRKQMFNESLNILDYCSGERTSKKILLRKQYVDLPCLIECSIDLQSGPSKIRRGLDGGWLLDLSVRVDSDYFWNRTESTVDLIEGAISVDLDRKSIEQASVSEFSRDGVVDVKIRSSLVECVM